MKEKILKIITGILLAILIVGIVVFTIVGHVRTEYRYRVYEEVKDIPQDSTLVVLGASVHPDQTPSDALEDRLNTAVRAWRAKKAGLIILSGDDGRYAQPETDSMLQYMLEQGVPEGIILVDGNNARTFDSCYRLKNELNQNDVVLFTQAFHLPRALYLCNEVGLDAWGVESDRRSYHKIVWFTFRDWMASFLAFLDIRLKRLPTYLENQ